MPLFGVILVRIFPAFCGIQTEYGDMLCISPYSVRMRENAGKMRTRITPNTDTFYAVKLRQGRKTATGLFFFISNNIQEFILDTELIPVIPSDDSPI